MKHLSSLVLSIFAIASVVLKVAAMPSSSDLLEAIRAGAVEEITAICSAPGFKPSPEEKSAFLVASEAGRPEVVKALLACPCPALELSVNGYHAFYMAARKGHFETVRLLIDDPRVGPRIRQRFGPLLLAIMQRNTAEVRLLLLDDRVDPATNKNQPLHWAALSGHTEIVEVLLADPRVNPADNDNDAIRRAARNGRLPVVQLLLANPRVNPADVHNLPFATQQTMATWPLSAHSLPTHESILPEPFIMGL